LDLSNQAIGRAGEFQAAALFELHGIVTTHVDIHGVDLWVETPSGRRVTVQVKTTLQPYMYPNESRNPRYNFQLRLRDNTLAEVYCLVALDLGLIRLLSAGEVPRNLTTTTKKLAVSAFTHEEMESDIRRYLY